MLWAGLGLLVAFQTVVILKRGSWPMSYDEALYIGNAVAMAQALQDPGLHRLADAYWYYQRGQAPLLPVATAPLIALGVPPLAAAMATLGLFTGALLVAAGSLARVLLPSSWAGAVPPLLLACWGITFWGSNYLFAIPAAATATALATCLLRSRLLTDLRWCAAGGLALGLCALSRTMMLALAPLLVASYLIVHAKPLWRTMRRSLLGLGIGAGIALVVAGSWYIRNIGGTLDYLLGYGYSDAATTFSGGLTRSDPGFYLRRGENLARELGLLAAVAVAVMLVTAVVAGRQGRVEQDRGNRSGVLTLMLWVVASLVALTSTTNQGAGFETPLLPGALILILLGVRRIASAPAEPLVALVAAALAVVNVVVQPYELGRGDDPLRHSQAAEKWRLFNDALAAARRSSPQVALEAEGFYLNTPSLRLSSLIKDHRQEPPAVLDHRRCRTAAACAAFIREELPPGSYIVLLPGPLFEPTPDADAVREAVRDCPVVPVAGARAVGASVVRC